MDASVTRTVAKGGAFANPDFDASVERLRREHIRSPAVLLIELPQFLYESFSPEAARRQGHYAFPPTGLLFVKQALSDRGLDIDVFDLNLAILEATRNDENFRLEDWPRLLDAALAKRDYSVVGMTGMSVLQDPTNPKFFLTAMTRHLRAKKRYVLVGGGSLATADHAYYLGEGLLDFVIAGEGELKARYLFDRLYGREPETAPQKGIFYSWNGQSVELEGRADKILLREDICELLDEIPYERHWAAGALTPFSRWNGKIARFGTVQLNRGCRGSCKFCGLQEFMGKGVRQRDTDPVIAEIRHMVEKRGVRHVDILDDDFLGTGGMREGLDRVLAEFKRLRASHGIEWTASNGLVAGMIDERMLSDMRDSGCLGFRLGVESGNKERLKWLRRPSNLFVLRRFARLLPRYPEIFVCGNLIIGFFDQEPFGEMMDTYRLALDLDFDWNGFTVFQFVNKQHGGKARSDGTPATDFVPSKNLGVREMARVGDLVSGPAVFGLPQDKVPSRQQVGEIWFAFNLGVNYVLNKNLRPGGRPEKMRGWLEAVMTSYPTNPYMPLFAGLAARLMGDDAGAERHLADAKGNRDGSEYWQWRFAQWGLDRLLDEFPKKAAEVEAVMAPLRAEFPGLAERQEVA